MAYISRTIFLSHQPEYLYASAYFSASPLDYAFSPVICYYFNTLDASQRECPRDQFQYEREDGEYGPNIQVMIPVPLLPFGENNVTVEFHKCNPIAGCSTNSAKIAHLQHMVVTDDHQCTDSLKGARDIFPPRVVNVELHHVTPRIVQCINEGERVEVELYVSDFTTIRDVDWIALNSTLSSVSIGKDTLFPWVPYVTVAGQYCHIRSYNHDAETGHIKVVCSVSVPGNAKSGRIIFHVLGEQFTYSSSFAFLQCGQHEVSFAVTTEESARGLTSAAMTIGFLTGVYAVIVAASSHTIQKSAGESGASDIFRFFYFIQFVSSLFYANIVYPPTAANYLFDFSWTNGMVLPPWDECVDPNADLKNNGTLTDFVGRLPDELPCTIPSESLFSAIVFHQGIFGAGMVVGVQIILGLITLLWHKVQFVRSKVDVHTIKKFPMIPLVVLIRVLLLMVHGMCLGVFFQIIQFNNHPNATYGAVTCLIIFVIGLPFLTILTILKLSPNNPLLDPKIRSKAEFALGSLYQDFRPDRKADAVLYLLRRMSVGILLGSLFDHVKLQFALIFVIGTCYTVYSLKVQPFATEGQNKINVWLEAAETSIAFFTLLFVTSEKWWLLSINLAIIVIVCLAFIYVTVRNADCCSKQVKKFRRRYDKDKTKIRENDFELESRKQNRAMRGANKSTFGTRSVLAFDEGEFRAAEDLPDSFVAMGAQTAKNDEKEKKKKSKRSKSKSKKSKKRSKKESRPRTSSSRHFEGEIGSTNSNSDPSPDDIALDMPTHSPYKPRKSKRQPHHQSRQELVTEDDHYAMGVDEESDDSVFDRFSDNGH